ncbi:ATP-binding protein, partial [Streptomyces sp. NPDC057433]|uniref:ATP-binding protein n=1 Tax=Streptomyces sp. NPDC057433 TaxID=3346132 RepID=UPI0036C7F2B7
ALSVCAKRPTITQSGLPFDAHLSRSERQQLLTVALAHDATNGSEAGVVGPEVVDLAEAAARASRAGDFVVKVLDLNEVIGHALGAVKPQMQRRGITLNEELWDDPIRVTGSVSDLEAIVFNLAANAIHSIAHASDLLGDRVVLVRTRVDGDHAVVDFSDSGPGIVDVDAVEMWRPGVIGRSSKGAGLGLTVVRDAMADMCGTRAVIEDGDLSADAYGELGGASFHIRLPVWLGQ